MNAYVFLYGASILVSAIAQLLLKLSALEKHESSLKEYLNFKVIFAYAIFFVSTALTMIAYRGVNLSYGPILESTGFIWIAGLSFFFLKEKLKKHQLLGVLFIVLGIFVFSL